MVSDGRLVSRLPKEAVAIPLTLARNHGVGEQSGRVHRVLHLARRHAGTIKQVCRAKRDRARRVVRCGRQLGRLLSAGRIAQHRVGEGAADIVPERDHPIAP
jgi:hypothetical protein